MNCGAKVPAGVLFLCELERSLVEPVRAKAGLLSCESDWFRVWTMACGGSASGEETRVDFGRVEAGVGPGEGDGELLAKGLLRHRGPFCAGALMVLLCESRNAAGATGLAGSVCRAHAADGRRK